MSEARDAGALEGVEELVVRSGQGGRGRKFHIPKRDEGTETLCHMPNESENLYRKSVEVYPAGWFEWCDQCISLYERWGDR